MAILGVQQPNREVAMATVIPSFLPAAIAARQRATVRKFQNAGAADVARARTLAELGVREDHLFGRLVKAGVVVKSGDGRYYLDADGLARWQRNARITVVVVLLVILIGVLIAFAVAATATTQSVAVEGLPAEEPRTEELKIERLAAKDALVAVRSLAGIREIEVRDLHTLSIHDTPAKLLLARQVVELLDHPKSSSPLQVVRDVGDGTTLASYALRATSARDAMRMLMGKIGIRRVTAVAENETVLFRDTREQVEAALALLDDFDLPAAEPGTAPE